MQLVEAGKLDLNADVSQYVNQFDIPNEFDTPLTLTHIMTHAPGLEDGAAGYLFADKPEDLMPLADSLAQTIPTQVRKPGKYSSYSNWATALAGLIVANVSGMTFEAYVEKNIFAPLGMSQATFEEPLPPRLAADMATGYALENGALEPFGFEYVANFGPAGALSAATVDMTKFMRAHLQDGQFEGQQILQPETVQLMHQELFSHDDRVAAMAHGFYEIWRNGQRFVGHGGDTIVFHSELVLDPDRDFGLFYSSNSPDGARARSAIVNGIIDHFYPREAFGQRTAPALDGVAERIVKIAGAYRINRRSYTKLEGITGLAGDLPIASAGENKIQIPVPDIGGQFVEIEPYVFQQVDGDETLVFKTHNGGPVHHAFIGSLPIMVADKVSFPEQASTHQLVIVLALLASLFVIINTIRNRKLPLRAEARWARWALFSASVSIVLFSGGLGGVIAGIDMNRVVFDFPPAGMGPLLALPILALISTIAAVVLLVPVWRSSQCGKWAALRYSYVTLVFVLLMAVFHYWNLIGWKY
jgi:CubicO group peptidase (beta-lactamase class C family)